MNHKPTRILLADPETQLLSAYRRFLETQGFEVATASSPEECWARLAEWSPDVFVLEPDTPDHWADEILSRLRDRNEHRPPVIVLSKLDRVSVDYPIQVHHVKPCSMRRLVQSINQTIDGDESELHEAEPG